MNTSPGEYIFDIELAPGEALSLPGDASQIIGPGSWRITIEPSDAAHERETLRDHTAFLNSYAPEDEGLYDDYQAG